MKNSTYCAFLPATPRRLASAAAAALLVLCACAVAVPAAAAGKASAKSSANVQTGLASYYARKLHGKKTATGESMDNDDLVAAHRTLPLGSRVRVTNLENDESVVVRIADRGASARNRREGVIIDVSQAAASRLKMKKDGRVRVRVEVLERGDDEVAKAEAKAKERAKTAGKPRAKSKPEKSAAEGS